jgi:hypothetical protein
MTMTADVMPLVKMTVAAFVAVCLVLLLVRRDT